MKRLWILNFNNSDAKYRFFLLLQILHRYEIKVKSMSPDFHRKRTIGKRARTSSCPTSGRLSKVNRSVAALIRKTHPDNWGSNYNKSHRRWLLFLKQCDFRAFSTSINILLTKTYSDRLLAELYSSCRKIVRGYFLITSFDSYYTSKLRIKISLHEFLLFLKNRATKLIKK